MKLKRIRVHMVFHYENESPYDIDITRQNPNLQQVKDIQEWVEKILLEEIVRLSKIED